MDSQKREATLMILGLVVVAVVCGFCYFSGSDSGGGNGDSPRPSLASAKDGSKTGAGDDGLGSFSPSKSKPKEDALKPDPGKLKTSFDMPTLTSGFDGADKK